MFGITVTRLCELFLQLVGWLVANPIASMSSFPTLLLAIAPAWYFRFGYRIPQVLFHTPKFERQAIVFTLLVMELCLSSSRTKLYCINSLVSFIFGVFSTVCVFVVSLAMVTDLRRLTNGCLDVLLTLDAIKSFQHVYDSTFDFVSLMLIIMSVTRFMLFLAEDAWFTAGEFYEAMKQSRELASAITSLSKSPFYMTSAENMAELGHEYSSQRLHDKFSHTWAQLRNDASLRYRLFWATIHTLKWDLAVFCVVRSALGIATLAQARALSYLLTIIEEENSSIIQRLSAFTIILMSFICYVIIRQMTTQLINRITTFVRGIFLGQIQSKTLRLSPTHAHDEARTTLMSTDMEDFTIHIPGLFEMLASAIELGAAISELGGYLGSVSLLAVIPALCTVIPSSRLSELRKDTQEAWTDSIRKRVSETAQILNQRAALKTNGVDSVVATYLKNLYRNEIDALRNSRHIQSLNMLIIATTDRFTTVFVISCALICTRFSNGIRPSTLFPCLLLLGIITERLITISLAHQNYISAVQSHDQVQQYLEAEEFQIGETDNRLIHVAMHHCLFNDSPASLTPGLLAQIRKKLPNEDPLQLLNASVTLPGASNPLFTKVSVSIPRGKLTVIIGNSGSGKSLFLKLLLGEVDRTEGFLYIEPEAKIAFCSRTVCLQQKSVKDNIVGRNTFNQRRYADVVSRCQLSEEIERLADGHDTLVNSIGATKLNRSLQYKIALARTAYSTASIVLIDDLLSSMDSRTAGEIFRALFDQHGLFKLQNRTVVLATCFREHLRTAALAVFLDGQGNTITRDGGVNFTPPQRLLSILEQLPKLTLTESDDLSRQACNQSANNILTEETTAVPDVQREGQHENEATLSNLLNTVPLRNFVICFSRMALTAALYRLPDIFASFWLSNRSDSWLYLLIFICMNFIAIMSNHFTYTHFFEHFTPKCLTLIYDNLIHTGISKNSSYLDNKGYAETVDKLNQNMTLLSRGLSLVSAQLIHYTLVIFSEVIIVGSMSGLTIPIIVCISSVVYFVQKFHIPHCEQLQGLKQETEKHLLAHHAEAATGIEYIRVSKQQATVTSRGFELLDESQISFYHLLDAKRWIDFVLDLISSGVIISIAVVGIVLGPMSTITTGLAILIVASISEKVGLAITFLTNLKTMLPSLQYVLDVSMDASADENELHTARTPGHPWQTAGMIELQNATATYGPGTTNTVAIRNTSISIHPGSKVGIIGPSGSGKSSMIFAILNFLEYTGSIKVDGFEVTTIPHHQLRSRITTFRSSFVQLPGTVEQNLMPWRLIEGYKDKLDLEKVTKVLTEVNLWTYIQRIGGLSLMMDEMDLSQGQQTRFLLARLILHHLHHENRVVMLDDPMAGMDAITRHNMLRALSKYFEASTVLSFSQAPERLGAVDVVYELQDGHVNRAGTSAT